MKGPLNPELKVGDKIMCYHMEGETGVPAGTIGIVTRISRDPFESENEKLIDVKWKNGSSLALVTSTDAWKKVIEEQIQEDVSLDPNWKFITKNPDIFEHFDWRWFREFLSKIRDSGFINMFGASPLLYSGKKNIDRYYGEGRENDRAFQEVLEDAEESKNKIVQGVIKYMEKNNLSIRDLTDESKKSQIKSAIKDKINSEQLFAKQKDLLLQHLDRTLNSYKTAFIKNNPDGKKISNH